MQRFLSILVLLAVLTACGGGDDVATTAPTVTTAAQVEPTPAFDAVTDEPIDLEPTAAAPTAVSFQSAGTLAWRDQILRNDTVTVQVSDLPAPPAGQVYAAWLVGADSSLALGALTENAGALSVTYVSPTQENLLAKYGKVYVAAVDPAQTATTPQNVVLAGAIPDQALLHVRHVLVSIAATPGSIGFSLGLRQETDELRRHAQFLKDAYDTQNLALAQVHAEHIINIISGSDGRDVNGDGKNQNPGDGFGLLVNGSQDGYIKGMIDHADLAASAPDATDGIKLHAGHVKIAGTNTEERVTQIRELAEQIATATSLDAINQPVLTILALSEQTIQGIDVNLDEQVGPVPGEGGVMTAYQHAQLMAGIELKPAVDVAAAPPVAAAPAEAPVFNIAIADNTFGAPKITIPQGAKVIWTHTGQKPHTVTADDGSFSSGRMENGATFEQTFSAAGTFPYFCEFHGGKGGQGMAGAIVVVEASTPPPVAQPVPTAAPTAAAPPAAGNSIQVAIGDNSFTPKELQVEVGTSVSWIHSGQRPHTVTADDGSFDSGTLQNGGSFEQTFDKPGVYAYFCEIHGGAGGQGMAAIIRVGDGGGAQNPPPAAAKANVSMTDFAFGESALTVKAGTTVTWTNNGGKPHSAHAVDGSFDTGLFQPGQSRDVTFTTPGTFLYFCELHGSTDGQSGMVATITVEP